MIAEGSAASAGAETQKNLMVANNQWDPVCPGCRCKYEESGQHTPLVLQCQHTACQDCLSKAQTDQYVQCPQCKARTALSGPTLESLPKNFALLDITVKRDASVDLTKLDTARIMDDAGATCPVCLDVFTDKPPLVFTCGHTCCSECVYGIALRCKDGTVTCPECRTRTQLNGALRVNVSLQVV